MTIRFNNMDMVGDLENSFNGVMGARCLQWAQERIKEKLEKMNIDNTFREFYIKR